MGHDLQRPECILAERDGMLWAADARGGVMRIAPDGTQRFIGQTRRRALRQRDRHGRGDRAKFTQGTLPNGLAFAANGDILIANFGTDCLEVMTRDGATRTLADRIDGEPIGKVNFVLRDSKDRLWITVSTRVNPGRTPRRSRVRDGYVALLDDTACASSPTASASPTKSASMRARNGSTSWRPPGRCISRLRLSSRSAA